MVITQVQLLCKVVNYLKDLNSKWLYVVGCFLMIIYIYLS